MKSLLGQIDQKTANIMAIAFVGIHIPMIALVLYGIFNSFTGLGALVVTILLATMISTSVSMYLIFKIVREIGPAGVSA